LSITGVGSDSDTIKFDITPNGGEVGELFRVAVDYVDPAISGSPHMKYIAQMVSIVEYKESGATSGFQSDEDNVVQYYTDAYWSSSWAITAGTGTQTFELKTNDGLVTLRLTCAEEDTTYNGRSVTSGELLMDIEVYNFGFSSTTSKLALIMQISIPSGGTGSEWKTYFSAEDITAGRIDVIVSDTLDTSGYLSWDNKVDLSNSKTANLLVTSEGGALIYGTYIYAIDTTSQPQYILFDPRIGVGYTSISGSDDGFDENPNGGNTGGDDDESDSDSDGSGGFTDTGNGSFMALPMFALVVIQLIAYLL